MGKKWEKQPEDHIRCPKCDNVYGFVRCRVTNADGSNNCLTCGANEERLRMKK